MIRDRIKELRRVRASELRPHPKNWRTHSDEQRDALVGLLDEIGLAGAVIARELPDGTLQLIDGHLRTEVSDDTELPVLVVDLSEDEAEKLLLAHDALTAMAGVDEHQLADLIERVTTESSHLKALFKHLAEQSQSTAIVPPADRPAIDVPQLWQIVVECSGEPQQRIVYEQLVADGFKCRLLTI